MLCGLEEELGAVDHVFAVIRRVLLLLLLGSDVDVLLLDTYERIVLHRVGRVAHPRSPLASGGRAVVVGVGRVNCSKRDNFQARQFP